jgi:Zn-dependent protease
LSPDTLRNLVLYLVPMILSLSVHEFAHAFVAKALGDGTADEDERVTLSPLAHIDPIGTLLVPAVSIISTGVAFLGWARPVPVNPARFRRNVNMRTGMAIVAAAGPLSNLLLALGSIGLWVLIVKNGFVTTPRGAAISALLQAMFTVNVGLCVFNFLPIPPLDGSRVLPRSMDDLVEKASSYSTFLILAVMVVPFLREPLIDIPMRYLSLAILSLFGLR